MQLGQLRMQLGERNGVSLIVCAQAEGRGYQETWLLLELCDKGSLRDAMDRGAFRPVRLGEAGTWVPSSSFSPSLFIYSHFRHAAMVAS